MAHSFLNKQNIFKRYKDAKDYTDKLTKPFPEFVRIARNKPMEGIEPYPPVTDGTLSAIITETKKRVVQQEPTGLVESDEPHDWLPIVAGYIFRTKILPFANDDYDLLEKCQLVVENGLTTGACATFNRFAQHDHGFGPDPELIYWGDLAIQKGKKSGNACSFVFYRTWWQKADIEALIDAEQSRIDESNKRLKEYKAQVKQIDEQNALNQAAAEANGTPFVAEPYPDKPSEYEPTWDIKALKKVADEEDAKDEQATTDVDEDRNLETNGIELVTGFQKGVGAKFYTFHPHSKTIVRTKTNNDPRGKMPIQWFYAEIDGVNPLGRGAPEVVGGLQNFIDARMQMAGYAEALELNPPLEVYGNYLEDIEYRPNAVFHAKTVEAKITPLTIRTAALNNYVNTQSYLQSQLYQRIGGQHTNISASNATVQDGKTPQALEIQQATLNVDINTLRKHFESWFENWSEDATNRYFAERSGSELINLDDETADELRKLVKDGHLELDEQGAALLEKNQIIINYDTATPALKFRVNAGSSKVQDDAQQLKAFELVQQFIEKSPVLAQSLPLTKQLEIYNSVVSLAGVEDPERIQISDDEMTELEQRMQQAQMQPEQPEQPDEEAQALQDQIAEWRQQGVPDERIKQAIAAYQQRGANV